MLCLVYGSNLIYSQVLASLGKSNFVIKYEAPAGE
jgi:hypothetical protein